MDITTLISQGITEYHAQLVDHGVSNNTGLIYKSKYLYHTFNDQESKLTVRFHIERYLSNGTSDISYLYDSVADDTTFVDNDGNIVQPDDPNVWGTEMQRMRVLFSAPISDKDILEYYQQELFNRGTFDFPKNRNL